MMTIQQSAAARLFSSTKLWIRLIAFEFMYAVSAAETSNSMRPAAIDVGFGMAFANDKMKVSSGCGLNLIFPVAETRVSRPVD